MRAAPLQRREILRYDEPFVQQHVFGFSGNEVVDTLRHGDIVIVMEDQKGPFITVMSPAGSIGWVYFITDRLLRIEHQIRQFEDDL